MNNIEQDLERDDKAMFLEELEEQGFTNKRKIDYQKYDNSDGLGSMWVLGILVVVFFIVISHL